MEKYKAFNSRKVYLVFNYPVKVETMRKASTKYFKISIKDLLERVAYLYNDELYFENPHKKGTKKCIAVESVRRRS